MKEGSEVRTVAVNKAPFVNLLAAGTVVVGGLGEVVLGDSLSELESLADKAKKEAKLPLQDQPQEKSITKGAKEGAVAAKPQEVAKKPKVDAAKRAESLGLLSRVSVNAAGAVTLMNGAKLWDETQESALGKVLIELLEENEVNVNDPAGPAAQIAPLLAEELMLVLGDGGSKQVSNLLDLSNWSDEYQVALMMDLLAMSLGGIEAGGDALRHGGASPFAPFKMGFEDNPDFLLNFASAVEMPPVLLGFRVSDDEKRGEYGAMLGMGIGMGLNFAAESMPFLSESSFEHAGISFNGAAIEGKQLVESLEDEIGLRGALEEVMDPAAAEDFIDTLKEKSLILAAGVSDEAIYLYLGNEEAAIPLAQEGEASLAGSDLLSFAVEYLAEDLLSVSWASEELMSAAAEGRPILGSHIEGVRHGLSQSKVFGETKKFEGLLDKLEVAEKSLLKLNQYTPAGTLSYLRGDGLHTESFGGVIEGFYDWEKPLTLSSDSDNAFLSVQWAESKAGREMTTEYLETAFEAAYEAATVLSKRSDLKGDLADYKEGFLLFDTKLKTDFFSLYKGLGVTRAGVGSETLMEVDLQGSWPTLPNLPETVIEEGLAPRISFVSAVTDRAKLTESWKEVEKAIGNLVKIGGELAEQEIPMQKPMSSQANDLVTWFFPIPMQTDDFVPSVTLNDEVIVLGTSKKRAIALANIAQEKPVVPKSGVSVVVNFDPLQQFLSSWLKLAEENPEKLFVESDLEHFFIESGDYVEQVITAMGEMDSWRSHIRMEEGVLRSTSHLMTK